MKQIIIYAAACVVLIALCVSRCIAAPGTFGIELFASPAILWWGVTLMRRNEDE